MASVGLLIAAPADAAVITFDNLGITSGTQLNTAPGVGIVADGFNYTPGPDNSSGLDDLHIDNGQVGPWNGTASGGTHDDVVLTKAGGGTFSLFSFDYAGFQNGEVSFRVVGELQGGGQVFASFTPDGISDNTGPQIDFETFLFDSSWTNLVSATWHHPGGNQGLFYLDNIVTDVTAPEPATASLLVLAAAAALRRRRVRS